MITSCTILITSYNNINIVMCNHRILRRWQCIYKFISYEFDIKAAMVINKWHHRNKYSVYYSLKFNIIHTYSTLSFYTSNAFICEVLNFRYILWVDWSTGCKKWLPNRTLFVACRSKAVLRHCGSVWFFTSRSTGAIVFYTLRSEWLF